MIADKEPQGIAPQVKGSHDKEVQVSRIASLYRR